jgi:GTP cyclohydrolase I
MIDQEKIKNLTYELLKALGENPERDGLKGTPERVAKMYAELCSSLTASADDFIKTFEEAEIQSDIIEVRDIPVYSLCEHHLLPFKGTASIKYVPQGKTILGLSKFARIVDCFARRPQVQERLTGQIADFIFLKLNAKGVEVTLECEHLCMTMRGAKAYGSITKTTAVRGNIK